MSGALANPKHEAFAQARAKRKTATEAYILAGFTPHDGNASRLSGNERIVARVAEIQQRAADRVGFTLERAVEIMEEIAENRRARGSDRVSASRAAGLWLGWEKQSAVQSAPIIIIKIGGDSPDNRD